MVIDAHHWQHHYWRESRYAYLCVDCQFGRRFSMGSICQPGIDQLPFQSECGIPFPPPVTYQMVNFLKKAEDEDFFDIGTRFSPI